MFGYVYKSFLSPREHRSSDACRNCKVEARHTIRTAGKRPPKEGIFPADAEERPLCGVKRAWGKARKGWDSSVPTWISQF